MRRYEPTDYPEIADWYAARGEIALPLECFPRTGLILPGVAAGFLYATDSALALIDCVVTNPEASPMARGRAVSGVLRALLDEAGKQGFRIVAGSTRYRGMRRSAERIGFKYTGDFAMMFAATTFAEPAPLSTLPDEV